MGQFCFETSATIPWRTGHHCVFLFPGVRCTASIVPRIDPRTRPSSLPPSFSQIQVKAQLSDIALKEGNVTLPSNYTLIDISFLDTIKPSESADLKTEEAFWAAQQAAGAAGQAGKLIHWRVNTQIILCCD